MLADFDNLRHLPLVDKLRVVEQLWDDIATSAEEFPLPEWLHDEMKQRLAEHEANPSATMTRDELWRQIDAKRG